MHQVLARKWRPRVFDEVVGQGQVTRTLANAVESDRLAHAYIFAGLRGTGKTSVARILAKCLNCEKGPTVSPCGECAPCIEIAESRAMDVLELDAASRTSVDNIRELQEVISYAPARDRFKVLIIDEAHMLSKQAFNALLKTLEEPPPNVVFVLATTEIQKVLPTILSRCQVFEFRRVGVRELTDHLRRVCEAESIGISDASLERVARAGEGSVRDSLSELERALAFCGREISDDDVLRMLGGVRLEVLTGMIEGLAARDAGAMLRVLDGLVDEGHDLLHFWSELIACLRDLLLLRAAPDRDEMLGRSADEARLLLAAAGDLSDGDLTRAFQLLADLEQGLKSSTQPRFLFDVALIRLAELGAVRPIEEVLATLGGGEPGAPAGGGGPVASRRRRPPARGGRPAAPRETRESAPGPAPVPAAESTPPRASAPPQSGSFAGKLIGSVASATPMLGVVLEAASAITAGEDEVRVAFPPGSEIMVRQLQRKNGEDVLGRHAERLLGRKVRIRIEGGKAAPEGPAGEPAGEASAAAPAESPPSRSRPASRRGARSDLLDQARKEPGVKQLVREFGGQVVDIRPLAVPKDPVLESEDAGHTEEIP